MSIFSIAGSTPSDDGFELKSARFNDGDSGYMHRTPAQAGNRRTFTISAWIKKNPDAEMIVSEVYDSDNRFYFSFPLSNIFHVISTSGGGAAKIEMSSIAVYRDPSAWYHVVLAIDTTQGPSSNRVRGYVNGEEITNWTTSTYPTQNYEPEINTTTGMVIGAYGPGGGYNNFFDGYMSEFYFIDGNQLTPSYFGETNELTNQWVPKNPTDIKQAVTFGTNGFYLPFSNDALADSFTDSAEKFATAGGAAHTDTAVKKWGTASAQFNGSSSYLTVPDSSAFNLFANTTDSQTLDFWVNHTVVSSGQVYFMPREDGSNYWFIRHDTPNILLYGKIGNSVFINQSASAFSNTGAWHHIALVKIANKLGVYVDGTQIIYTTFSSTKDFAAPLTIGSQDGSSDFFNGYMDEVRWSNSNVFLADPNSTPDDTITVPTGAFTPDSNTKLLLHMDGANDGTSFPDSSESGGRHTITANGNTTNTRVSNLPVAVTGDAHVIGPAQGTSVIHYDGSGDSLTVPASADWNFGTGDFTIEFWANIQSGNGYLLSMGTHDGASSIAMSANTANGNTAFDIRNDSSTNTNMVASGIVYANRWYHYAVCRNGSKFYAYIDGVFKTSGDNDPSGNYGASTNVLYSGQISSGGFSPAEYIDSIRISKGVARYPGGTTFTPPTEAFVSDANTVFLLQSGTDGTQTPTTDTGNTGHTITYNGDARWIAPKFGKGCAYFDGTNDGVSIANNVAINLAGGDFTIDLWFKGVDVDSPNLQSVLSKWNVDNIASYYLLIHPTAKLRWYLGDGGSTGNEYVGDSTIADNTWYHAALTRSGNIFTAYLDGVEAGQISKTDFGDNTLPLIIGNDNASSRDFRGYTDEVRISKGIVRWTENFTPPATAYKDDKNTTVLLHMDGGGNIDPETNLPTATAQGIYFWNAANNAIFYNDIGVPTNKSMIDFDGSDKLTVAASSDWNFGTNPFTIEGWVYADTLDGGGVSESCTMLSSGTLATADHQWRAAIWSIGSIMRLSFAIYETAGGGGWPVHMYPNTFVKIGAGQWYHWAVTRSGNTWSMWTNGICTADDVDSLNWNASSLDVVAGYVSAWSSNRYLDGKQDQIRISDTSRYTGTYTVPTAAFSSDSDTSLLLHMDGSNDGTTFTDSSSHAHTITVDGNIVTKTGEKKFGTASAYFNGGSGNELRLADDASLRFGTGAFTIEAWVYPVSAGGSQENMIVCKGNASTYWMLRHEENNVQGRMRWQADVGGASVADIKVDLPTTRWAYDTWHHVAVTSDGTTHALLVDGTCIGACTASIANWDFNTGDPITIGNIVQGSIAAYGYIDELRISKGVARYSAGRYTVPTEPFTTDANTKLLIQSDFSEGGLGADHSGNYNYFTPTNLTVNDMMEDSPKNNFCTWNPIASNASFTLTEGNLATGNEDEKGQSGTIGVSSGKWYWEAYIGTANSYGPYMGITKQEMEKSAGTSPNLDTANIRSWAGGTYRHDYTQQGSTSTGSYFTSGYVLGFALDLDNGTMKFYDTGVLRHTDSTLPTDGTTFLPYVGTTTSGGPGWHPSNWNFGQDSSFAGLKTAQGNQDGNNKGDFYYAPPAGYLALCTDNLPTPSIALPEKNFNTVLYTGDGQTTKAITGVGFQPDFTWLKQRSSTGWYVMSDAVRGATKRVASNSANIEATDATYIASFGSDGITVGNNSDVNANTATYVTWNWKASGAGAANTSGSIDSTVSANTTAGFSVVTYTGEDNAGDTVGHGLSQAPELILVKDLTTAEDWQVYDASGGPTKYLQLNDAAGYATDTTRWNDTAPTATVFSLGTSDKVNDAGDEYVAYCFHSVEGYSKVDAYFGNGNADGAFIYTGFKPAYVLVKNSASSTEWMAVDDKRDTYNVTENLLYPYDTAVESTQANNKLDLLSNGFKIRGNASALNGSGHSLIYLAFAESPFKTSNAR